MPDLERLILRVCALTYVECTKGKTPSSLVGLRLDGSDYGGFTRKDGLKEVDPEVFLGPMVETVRSRRWDLVVFSQAVMLPEMIGTETVEETKALCAAASENPMGEEEKRVLNGMATAAVGVSRSGESGATVFQFTMEPRMGGSVLKLGRRVYFEDIHDTDYEMVADILRRMVSD